MLDHDLVLKSDELYLVGESHTDGSGERATGLYVRDTRHLSRFDIRLNDSPLDSMGARVVGPSAASVTEANGPLLIQDGITVRPHSIAVEQRIELTDRLTVSFRVRNFTAPLVTLILELTLASDFRDLFDIRGFPRRQHSGTTVLPVVRGGDIELGYVAPDGLETRTAISFDRVPTDAMIHPSNPGQVMAPTVLLPGFDRVGPDATTPMPPAITVRFAFELPPGAEWEMTATVAPFPANGVPVSAVATLSTGAPPRPATVTTDSPIFNDFLERCRSDLQFLQTSFPQGSLPAAGIPWYVAPFGRDSLIIGLQTCHATPDRAAGTLRVLASLQGSRVDPWRDEEPGKILHEVRYGEMARLGEVPHTPYYGTVDATSLFVLLFAETVAWTGDERLYCDLKPNVLAALDWMEQYGDRDGDDLIEYYARSTGGAHIIHQGWKDSHDSLHYANGEPVSGLIALVEVQGYAFAATRRLADVAEAFGDQAWGAQLRNRAELIRQRVEELFWLEDEGFYAQALDQKKQPVDALSSNVGHLLYCGLPSEGRGRQVAARLGRPEFNSGWGIRTLASTMSTYNPMSYHNGSVWPHDNSLIAAGMRQYGDVTGANAIASALFQVAQVDQLLRLPELYCGFMRAEGATTDVPVPYPVSCSPQGWAAGAGTHLLRTMLGLGVDVATRQLVVDPGLPTWLNWVEINGMRFFGADVSLRVERSGDRYDIQAEPSSLVRPAMMPASRHISGGMLTGNGR